MEIVEAVVPGLIELYRKWREFAIAAAPVARLKLCYNSANSNLSSEFIMTSGVNA
jgi:hypothetical protein